jgi:hypothetical protein
MTGSLALSLNRFGVFSDDVFTSTELNRRTAEVLNHAREHPVTIERNNERFALIRREQAADLFNAVSSLASVLDVIRGFIAIKKAQQPPPTVAWIQAFEEDDQCLMIDELLKTATASVCGEATRDELADLLYQWRESSHVILSGVLRDAMTSEADEQPLTNPHDEKARLEA